MTNAKLLTLVLIAALPTAAMAKNPRTVTKRTQTEVDVLLSCRAVADAQARLACYDDKAAKLSTAVAERNVVIIDKVQAHEASRALFGFSIPNFGGLFGGGDEIQKIDSTVASSGYNADGGLILTLADGSVWSQTDDKPTIPPRHGEKVTVSRGMMGSFFVETRSSNMFKAKRVG